MKPLMKIVCGNCGSEATQDTEQSTNKRCKIMGMKYTISCIRSGVCDYAFNKQTNNIFIAIWYLLTLSAKYPIIDIGIRRGYIICEECDANWCDKSPKWDRGTDHE